MNDSNMVLLDAETTTVLETLAESEGIATDEYLRKLLFDRASALLKKMGDNPISFFAGNGGLPPSV